MTDEYLDNLEKTYDWLIKRGDYLLKTKNIKSRKSELNEIKARMKSLIRDIEKLKPLIEE